MRLHQQPRLGHFVFVLAQNLSQAFDFLVHAVQHLTHGIYFHFPAFETLQRESNGEMLRQLHEHALIELVILALFGDARQRVSQHFLRVHRHLVDLLLEFHCGARWILSGLHPPQRGQRAQNAVDSFFSGLPDTKPRSSASATVSGCACTVISAAASAGTGA